MKKRVCFAGFVEEELTVLQPALAAQSGSWDCVFSPDAKTALEAMETTPFDAVVASLSPTGIRDLDLLQQAALKCPRTMRFILGDTVDRALMVSCMGSANQFISRPWKPHELIATIERSMALDAWLSNDRLRSFVPRLGKLPGLPATYFEVLKKAESPNSSVESIAEVIMRDPSLTARLLQMVNSSACGLPEKISSPTEAVSMLGVDTVKSIVLCLQLFAESSQTHGSLSLDQLWRHSFAVAKLAARIVLRSIGSERMASEAYTAGLLHNIGQIVLATNLANEHAVVVESAQKLKIPIQEAESKLLGVTSDQVGAYLLGLWGMPLPILEATALHNNPSSASSIEFSVLTAVHVANVMAHEEAGRVHGLVLPKLDAQYLATLELPRKVDAWRKFLASSPNSGAFVEQPEKAREMAPEADNEEESSTRPNRKLLVFSVCAVAVVVAMVVKNNLPAAQRNTPTATPNASSAPAAATTEQADGTANSRPAAAPPKASAFDTIKVQGIVYSAGHPVALINGQALDVGARISGVQVVSIEPSKVVLAFNGEQRAFKLGQ